METMQQIAARLDLQPHPEGGFYRRTYCSDTRLDGRGTASAILFLLDGDAPTLWHTTDGDELWFWQAGSTMTLETALNDGALETVLLGPDSAQEQHFQALVPAGTWQRSCSRGSWTLVSCVVSPEFRFEGYELVTDPNWMPGQPR